MSPAFVAPKGALDRKPPHGAPCTRCGLCCQATLCKTAMHVFDRPSFPGPCPALRFDRDGRSSCGLVDQPEAYAPAVVAAHGRSNASNAAAHLIGAATGCDARFNGEPIDEAFYARLLRWDREHERRTRTAGRIWGHR